MATTQAIQNYVAEYFGYHSWYEALCHFQDGFLDIETFQEMVKQCMIQYFNAEYDLE